MCVGECGCCICEGMASECVTRCVVTRTCLNMSDSRVYVVSERLVM